MSAMWLEPTELLEALEHNPAGVDQCYQAAAEALVALQQHPMRSVSVNLEPTKASIGQLLRNIRAWCCELGIELEFSAIGYRCCGGKSYEIFGFDGQVIL